jgi:hypothetical protein
MMGPVLSRIPEWANIVQQALPMAIDWASRAAANLQNPAIADIVLAQWLGMTTPSSTAHGGQQQNVLLKAEPTEKDHIVGLCETVVYILKNAVIEHGTQDPENNDCLSNPANVAPYAYVKRFQENGKKGQHYRIYLCSHAFVLGHEARSVHHYNTKEQQIAALLVHEAFHHASNPGILDASECLGKMSALWCGKCRPDKARNNGYSYQYVVSQAANQNPIQYANTSSLDCARPYQPSMDWVEQVRREAIGKETQLAQARANVRAVIASTLDDASAKASDSGNEAEKHTIAALSQKVKEMSQFFLEQAAALGSRDTATAASKLASAQALYRSMVQPPPQPKFTTGPIHTAPRYVYKVVRQVVPVVNPSTVASSVPSSQIVRQVFIPQQNRVYRFG